MSTLALTTRLTINKVPFPNCVWITSHQIHVLMEACFSDKCVCQVMVFENTQNTFTWSQKPMRDSIIWNNLQLKTVQCALHAKGRGGSYFSSNEVVRGVMYFQMLEHLHRINSSKFPQKAVLLLDGDPTHIIWAINSLLDTWIRNLCTGRCGPACWPEKAPCKAPLDFLIETIEVSSVSDSFV